MTLSSTQFPFHRLADEISTPFFVPEHGIYAIQRTAREPGWRFLAIYSYTSHVFPDIIY